MDRRQVLKLGAAATAVAFAGPLALPKKGWSLEGTMDLSVFERDQERLEALMPALRDIVEKQDWRFDQGAGGVDNSPAAMAVREQLDAAIAGAFPHAPFDWNIVPGTKPKDRDIFYPCFSHFTMFHRLEVIVYNGPIWASIDVVRYFAFPARVPSREERLDSLLKSLELAAATMEKADAVVWINTKLGNAFPGELFAWSIAPTGYFFTWGVPPNIYFHQMGVQIAPGSANAIGRTISVERYGSEISTTVMTARSMQAEETPCS